MSNPRFIWYRLPSVWLGLFIFTLHLVFGVTALDVSAQQQSDLGSRNIELVGHVTLEGLTTATSETNPVQLSPEPSPGQLVIEQDAGRPFVYLTRPNYPSGVVGFDVSDPTRPKIVFESAWPGSVDGMSATDITYFKRDDRFYVVVGAQHPGKESKSDLGAVVFDVTDLSNGGEAQEVARIHVGGGLHHLFAYRHSSGNSLLFATGGGNILVYEIASVLSSNASPVAEISIPEDVPNIDYGFHSVFAAYHPETESDRLYTGAAGGYFVYGVTDLTDIKLLASINSAAVQIGHTIAPTPDGSLVVTTAGYRTAPVRVFDLRPALDETIPRVRTAIGAWAADWRNFAENLVLRWPFVFVASTEDGFQAFNLANPSEPYTVGYYHTSDAPSTDLPGTSAEPSGAWDIDVRNSDGLIVVSDVSSGFWIFRMEGFEGWDGRGWGLPNISGVQDWDEGPQHSISWPDIAE
ncbi:MAG: hypothetical protein E2O85_02535 [Bacteroidetes bacterium]|nr:MAG: hypothetical protein E2O85_02535 [Bacteroidota bacterium]